ncbi:MAG: hypothetical protein FOGNACKC_05470 [Anaerolineae bacterium]|nr:hypothetical protein [Anaerolineae bacterium]
MDDLQLEGFIDADHADDIRAQAFTRPHLVFRVDNYFIDYWLPLLGPTRAWLVIAMQQACWQGSKPGRSLQLAQDELGAQCNLGRQRVNELLSDALVAHFIADRQAMFKSGQRRPNSYDVRLTSPLIPAQAAGLQQEIASRLAAGETLAAVMQALIGEAQTARTTLLERLTRPGTPDSFTPHTITGIVQGFAEPGQLANNLRRQINVLAGLLLEPKSVHLEKQYLRQDWLPLLGHAGTWLVVVIRQSCYADDTEVRDTFSMEKSSLAGRLGVSENTIRRLVKNKHLPTFFRPLADDGSAWQPGRYRLEGRVAMKNNPLTPADRAMNDEQVQPEPPKGDTVNQQKATRLEAEPPKGDTVNQQKATRLEAEPPKGDTVNRQKATRLEAEPPKGDTVTDREPPKGDSDSAPFKDSALFKDSDQESLKAGAAVKTHIHAHEPAAAAALPEQPDAYLLNLYRQEIGPAKPIIQNQIKAAAVEIPDHDLWERAFAEMAAANKAEWRYVLAIARRMQRDAAAANFAANDVTLPPNGDSPAAGDITPPHPAQSPATPPPSPTEALWQETLDHLRLQMSRQTFDAWLKGTALRTAGESVWTVECANTYAKDWLENRLRTTMERAAGSVAGGKVTLNFVTQEQEGCDA